MKKIFLSLIIASVCSFTLMANGTAEVDHSYPTKPVKIVVPYGAGGGSDITIRLLAKYMEPTLGQNIVIQNVSGGSGTIGWTQVSEAKPDGYTLSYGDCLMSNGQLLFKGITYDNTSFTPIAMYANDPHIIVASKNSGITSFQQLVEYVKQHPGQVTFGLGGAWTSHDFLRLSLEEATGISFKRMVFQSGALAVTAVAGGNCMVAVPFVSEALAQIEAGNVIPLAVSSAKRIDVAPQIPTIKECGVDYTHTMWRGIIAPAGLPDNIIHAVDTAIGKAFDNPEYVKAAKNAGSFPEYMGYDQFHDYFNQNHETYKALITKALSETN
ncbi:MAG: tripartite tricarboxylate transporter substrate binding protein [Spirochaetia bacterium]|nr:tripartite tricarboxylate transporter substrate binding protein [Spirochaetia bacterium]